MAAHAVTAQRRTHLNPSGIDVPFTGDRDGPLATKLSSSLPVLFVCMISSMRESAFYLSEEKKMRGTKGRGEESREVAERRCTWARRRNHTNKTSKIDSIKMQLEIIQIAGGKNIPSKCLTGWHQSGRCVPGSDVSGPVLVPGALAAPALVLLTGGGIPRFPGSRLGSMSHLDVNPGATQAGRGWTSQASRLHHPRWRPPHHLRGMTQLLRHGNVSPAERMKPSQDKLDWTRIILKPLQTANL